MAEISIVVPVYNVEKYIHRCINSILEQSYSDFELILVDDGSPDNCGKICEEYATKDSRIKVIHQKNGGLSVARNTGLDWVLANSDSEWITFIDSDDWVNDRYLETLLDGALKYNVPISMCWGIKTDGEEKEPENFDVHLRKTEDAYTYNGKFIAAFAWGRLYRKELFLGYRFPPGKLWEDSYLIHKILFQTPEIAVIEQPLYYYYRNPQSTIRQKWSMKKMDVIYAYEEEILPFFKGSYPDVYIIACKGYFLTTAEQMLLARNAGNKKDALNLRHKLCFGILSHLRKVKFPIQDYCWVYELAFPVFMKIYWYVKAIHMKMNLFYQKKGL